MVPRRDIGRGADPGVGRALERSFFFATLNDSSSVRT
jgi:hypothetical protein